jgi:hypothetical protein
MTGAVTCPQAIRTLNHKEWTGGVWQDPVYQAIADAAIKGQPCAYCGRPATLAHHDSVDTYRTATAYYDPANMTPACGSCHEAYRRGLIKCPTCETGYMARGAEQCSRCRGVHPRPRPRAASRHPCRYRLPEQRCRVRSVCEHPAQRATACEQFRTKE